MPGKSAPKNETPEERFIRLANGRWARAMSAIEGIGKLVGSQYKSVAAQHAKLITPLREQLDRAERSLAANKPAPKMKGGVL